MTRSAVAGRLAPLVLAVCWLAVGPGAVTLRAVADCRHHHLAHHQHHQPGTPSPDGAPCFCGEMSQGGDLTVPPAVPDLDAPAARISAVIAAVPFPLPPAPFPSFSPQPEPPPPNRPA